MSKETSKPVDETHKYQATRERLEEMRRLRAAQNAPTDDQPASGGAEKPGPEKTESEKSAAKRLDDEKDACIRRLLVLVDASRGAMATCRHWMDVHGYAIDFRCSLSDVLVATGEVPPEFYLSPTACRGILRRAAKRGRELPPDLLRALQAVAGSIDQDDDKRTT